MHCIIFSCVAQTKLDQEIKERDEKYSELDSKFNRLHKRAKQRIQEIQKVILHYFLPFNFFVLILCIFSRSGTTYTIFFHKLLI